MLYKDLWKHQKDAVMEINRLWSSGTRAILDQLCTGGGKSRIIRTIVDEQIEKKKVIYIIAHRDKLVEQLSKELMKIGIKHGIIKSGSPYIRYRVQVCSMATLVNRIKKKNLPNPDIIIVDECFPRDTIINGINKKIQDIKVGDMVLSYDEVKNQLVNNKVLSTMKRELKEDLIKITLVDNREIICTRNHPIMTSKGWMSAEKIGVSDGILYSLRSNNKREQKNMFKRVFKQIKKLTYGKNKQKICKQKDVREQPNEKSRDERKGFKNIKRNRTQTNNTGWKWETNANTATNIIGKIRRSRVCGRMCGANKNGKTFRISNMLQNRLRESKTKTWYRNRWEFSLLSKKASSRQKENSVLGYIRVANIEVQKYRSRQWIKSMHGSDYVYNFEVENTNTYLVSNCIVHNCHHMKNNSYNKIINQWPDAKLLGMTATPQRQDGKGLDDIFEEIIIGPPMRDLIESGSLSDYDYYAPPSVDMEGVHSRMGDYVKKESEERVDKNYITGNVIEHYKKYADHKATICCCISIDHSEHVAQQFREAGYKAQSVNSKMSKEAIKNCINGLDNGSIEILTQCDMLGEGVDIPGVECLIQLRPTQSLVIFLQQCGRSLRAAPGKKKAIILDHVGNYKRFGLPDEDRVWTLEGKKVKDKGQIKYKHCPECLMVAPIAARECPNCGYLWAQTREAGKRQIEEKEGKLVAIKSVDRQEQQDIIKMLAKAHNLKQCIKIARENGIDHKSAWYVWTKVFNNNEKTIIK
jgi:superfamily II DNA or RNA helicase